MKKIFYSILIIIHVVIAQSCKKMDSTYKDFVVPGGLLYPAKVSKPVVYAGRNRVQLAWPRSSDAKVVKAKVFWNNLADSVEVPVSADMDTIRVIIGNLDERSYSFIVRTYDSKGNSSVPLELIANSYGLKYQEELVSRPAIQSDLTENGELSIIWGSANITGGAYATDVEYTDLTNKTRKKRVRATVGATSISDYKPGTTYKYRTVYVPDSMSIDTFYTDFSTKIVSSKISKADWLATTNSFAATSQLPKGGPAKFAIDDFIDTFWHTDHTTTKPPFPHWLAVDMKKVYNVSRVELTCRPGVTNTFTEFTIQGSMDGINWTSYDSYILIQKDPTQSFLINGTPQMRHIRIFATKGPNHYANLAEFSVFGYQ